MSPLFGPVSAGGVPKATVTGTTGSPTIDTASRAGKTIYKFTGSGSITVGTAGSAEVLIVSGGGGGQSSQTGQSYTGGGGGGGGLTYDAAMYLPSGTYTIAVGAGGTGADSATIGGQSSMYNGQVFCVTPLGGGIRNGAGGSGAGGSAAGSIEVGGAARFGQGNAGGASIITPAFSSGGGGGAGGAGGNGTSGAGGAAGAGVSLSITGSSISYGGGGTGGFSGAGVAGTANTGKGGGGGTYINASTVAGAGGSGVVIVVVG